MTEPAPTSPAITAWQWPAVVLYSVAFITIGTLVALEKMHSEALLSLLAVFAPSPLTAFQAARAAVSTSTVHTEITRTVEVPTIPVHEAVETASPDEEASE